MSGAAHGIIKVENGKLKVSGLRRNYFGSGASPYFSTFHFQFLIQFPHLSYNCIHIIFIRSLYGNNHLCGDAGGGIANIVEHSHFLAGVVRAP